MDFFRALAWATSCMFVDPVSQQFSCALHTVCCMFIAFWPSIQQIL